MTPLIVAMRSLGHYWRGNLVVVFGVAVAVAVQGGALLVGDSVRGTLSDLALARIGATDVAITSTGFFRDELGAAVATDPEFRESFDRAAPFVALDAIVTAQATGRRAQGVRVYGVDDRFWRFHGRPVASPGPRQAYVSPALAEDVGATVGTPILVRVQLPSDVPLDSLHGRKDDVGRSMRATVAAVLPAEDLGEFSLSHVQGRIRAVFLPLAWVREQLEIGARANAILVASPAGRTGNVSRLQAIALRVATPEDAGLTFRALPAERVTVVDAAAGLLDAAKEDAVRRAATKIGRSVEPVLTYLADTIRVGDREVPYSLVAARDLGLPATNDPLATSPIVFNTWLANDLGARPGDAVHVSYQVWVEPGGRETRSATFRLAGVRAIGPDDRHLSPQYPGITDSPTLDEWDPPFPIDLRRVRPVDEAYWRDHRTTPKAFVTIGDGQRLWGSRYGRVTSMRVADEAGADMDGAAVSRAVASELDAQAAGLVVRDVRAEALAASRGVTDVGAYFVYFSFFLVVSALVLAALFFKLGIDERARQVGLLAALGASPAIIRRLFLIEGTALAGIGAALGAVASLAYAAAIVGLLRTWWVDAVGTSALALHVSVASVAMGAAGGALAAVVSIWYSLRHLSRLTPRALVAGLVTRERGADENLAGHGRRLLVGVAVFVCGLALAGAALAGLLSAVPAFFGASVFTLVSGLMVIRWWYGRPHAMLLARPGTRAMISLGVRNASANPGRSVLSIAVIAAAVFTLLAVDVFRKDAVADTGPTSGVGGYALLAESLLPIAHDLGTPAGRQAVGLRDVRGARFEPFRLRPGDDTSCLNLYQPTNPRLLGVTSSFAKRGRFRFGASLASTDAERANPWLLLDAEQPDGAVPVIGDANSLTYVLHKSVGDVVEIPHATGTVRLRIVAALADSLFQGELLVAETAFLRLFPEQGGYRFWLIEPGPDRDYSAAVAIEDDLAAFGVDVLPSTDRLAEFHRVENTYLATFQALGGLGLLLGTCGLAAVLLRNVVERRRELALFGAVGFGVRHIRVMLLAETVSLLVCGLVVGAIAAAVASAPAVAMRGGGVPVSTTGLLVLVAVGAAGVAATALAARVATRQPLVAALRSE